MSVAWTWEILSRMRSNTGGSGEVSKSHDTTEKERRQAMSITPWKSTSRYEGESPIRIRKDDLRFIIPIALITVFIILIEISYRNQEALERDTYKIIEQFEYEGIEYCSMEIRGYDYYIQGYVRNCDLPLGELKEPLPLSRLEVDPRVPWVSPRIRDGETA